MKGLPALVIVVTIAFSMITLPAYASVPAIVNITLDDHVFLNAGSFMYYTCNATIIDEDGQSDPLNVSAVIYDSISSSVEAGDDNNDHYTNASCALSRSGNVTNASCSFEMLYYSNPSDWECMIQADDSNASAENETSFSVEELSAYSAAPLVFQKGDSPIPLGNISDESGLNLTNLGNTNLSFELEGGNLTCSPGIIPVENLRYSTIQGFDYPSGTPLESDPAPVPDFLLPPQVDDSQLSTGFIYWLLQVPANGVGGSCSGVLSISL